MKASVCTLTCTLEIHTLTLGPSTLDINSRVHKMWIRARIARGQTNRSTSGVTSPLQRAEHQILHFSPLKRGRDPEKQTMCLPPGYPGKGHPSAGPQLPGRVIYSYGVLGSKQLCIWCAKFREGRTSRAHRCFLAGREPPLGQPSTLHLQP